MANVTKSRVHIKIKNSNKMRYAILLSGNGGACATMSQKLKLYDEWRTWNRYGFLYLYESAGDAFNDLKNCYDELKAECEEYNDELLNGLKRSDCGKFLYFQQGKAEIFKTNK